MPKPVATIPKPRQARALETRRKLVDAARAAFHEHGVEGTSVVEHILKPSGVSTGSFYHQFGDKTDLLIEVISDSIEQRHGLILGWPSEDGAPTKIASDLHGLVRVAFERFFDSLDDERHAWRIQLSEQHHGDARVRKMVLAGRERWVQDVAAALGRFGDHSPEAVRHASIALVSFATGTANIYLSLDAEERAERRDELLSSTTAFAAAGTKAFLD